MCFSASAFFAGAFAYITCVRMCMCVVCVVCGVFTSRLFGTLFTVDNLKNVKSAWSNDLSAYKRLALLFPFCSSCFPFSIV